LRGFSSYVSLKNNSMGRQFAILTFLLTIFFLYCRQISTETKNGVEVTTTSGIDTSVIAIFSFDTLQNRWYKSIFKTGKPIELTFEELLQIDTLLNTCINDYNPAQEREYLKYNIEHPDFKRDKKHFLIYLNRYKRQYLAIKNQKGEKEVWINCLCTPMGTEKWKSKIISVEDGGNCFFNVKVNLTKRKCYELKVNNEA